jgi:GxxExxY protein
LPVRESKLKHAELTERIIGVYYEVYNELGHGFLESVYQNAMYIGLQDSGLRVQRELAVPVRFRGQVVGEYRADLLVESTVIVELKAVHVLEQAHEVQLFHYLRATEYEVGLLLNFGAPRPQFKRAAFENSAKKPHALAAKQDLL